MNKQFKILIGANYGDEGKGEICRCLCKTMDNPIVITDFNTGSSHNNKITNTCWISSAYPDNYPLYITSKNPITVTEIEGELRYLDKFINLNKKELCYIDYNCCVITPIEMSIQKQFDIEIKDFISITINELFNNNPINVCKKVFDHYNNIYNFNCCFEDFINNKDKYNTNECYEYFYDVNNFCLSVNYLKDNVTLTSFLDIYNKFNSFVFLNTRGLLYYNDKINFNTNFIDMINVQRLLDENNINNNNIQQEIIYVTRPFITSKTKIDWINYNDISHLFSNKYIFKKFFITNRFFIYELTDDVLNNLISRCDEYSHGIDWSLAVVDYDIYNNKIIYDNHVKYLIDSDMNLLKFNYNNNDMIKNTKLLLQHNHNSGLAYIVSTNDVDVCNLSFMPFRLDYPCNKINWTVCNSITYWEHINQMIKNNCYKHCLQLLDKDFVMDKQRLKDFYINECQFKTFITASLKQAEDIKDLDPNSHVIYYGDNPVKSKFIDDIILPSDYEGKLPEHFGIRMDNHNIDEVMCKWYGKCDFLFLEYDVWIPDDVFYLIDKYEKFEKLLSSLQNTSEGV